MAAKRGKRGVKPEVDLDGLLEGPVSPFELGVFWTPGASQPIRFYFIRVNGRPVLENVDDRDSPKRVPLPEPVNGKFVVEWALVPSTPLDGIVIGIANRESGVKTKVDQTADAPRGKVWMNKVVVDAP